MEQVKRNVRYAVVAGLALAWPAYAIAGPCDPNQAPQKKSGIFGLSTDMVKSVGGGAAAGGILGGVIGNNTGNGDAAEGAKWGTIIGAGAGVIVGKVAEQRRAEFESESAFLSCEIEKANNALIERTAQVNAAQTELQVSKQRVQNLQTKAAQNRATAEEIRRERGRLENDVARYDMRLTELQGEIDYLTEVEMSSSAGPGDNPQALEQQKMQLAQNRMELQARFYELNDIKDEVQIAANSLPSAG